MAEAYQMLGALRRAEQRYMALAGASQYMNVGTSWPDTWPPLGVAAPSNRTFWYACDYNSGAGGNRCYAFPMYSNGTRNDGVYMIFFDDGTWNCDTGYAYQQTNGVNDASKPCVPR